MCKAVEDLVLISEERGRAEGEAKGENNIIKKMRAAGMSEEEINAILAVELDNVA